MPFFICPSCGNRETGQRTSGFTARPRGCSRCGFGFLFELLDDYYPAPESAFFTCDAEGRILDIGKGGFELTGLSDEQVIGRAVEDVLGLQWASDGLPEAAAEPDGATSGGGSAVKVAPNPIETTLEWGVRSMGKPVTVHAEGDLPVKAMADVFPAYDDDGGLLLVLTPE